MSSLQRVKTQDTKGLHGLLMKVASVGQLSKEKRNLVAQGSCVGCVEINAVAVCYI